LREEIYRKNNSYTLLIS